jgi:hypothetical protein
MVPLLSFRRKSITRCERYALPNRIMTLQSLLHSIRTLGDEVSKIAITLKTPKPRRTDGASLCYGLP